MVAEIPNEDLSDMTGEVMIVTEVKIVDVLKTVKEGKIDKEVKIVLKVT